MGEETGLYGSSIFARALVGEDGATLPDACRFDSSGDHRGLVFDMIGWRNPSFDQDTLLLETYEWAGFLRDHVATANQVNFGGAMKLLCSNNPFGSDHMPFLHRKIPVVLSIDNDGNCDKYPCYHQACDTRENVNATLATNIVKLNVGALLRIANTTTAALTTSASNGNGNGVAPEIWYALALTGAIVALLALIALYITSRSQAGVVLQSPVQFSSSV